MDGFDCLSGFQLALMSPISPVRALVHAREILDCLAWRLRFLFSLLFMILADSIVSIYLSVFFKFISLDSSFSYSFQPVTG